MAKNISKLPTISTVNYPSYHKLMGTQDLKRKGIRSVSCMQTIMKNRRTIHDGWHPADNIHAEHSPACRGVQPHTIAADASFTWNYYRSSPKWHSCVFLGENAWRPPGKNSRQSSRRSTANAQLYLFGYQQERKNRWVEQSDGEKESWSPEIIAEDILEKDLMG